MMKPEISSATDVEGFRLLMGLQTSASDIGARDKNSEECNRWGWLIEQQLL
jgi:hypothetical protein